VWRFLKPTVPKKKALLIAAGSATGMEPLIGAQVDVERMRTLLIGKQIRLIQVLHYFELYLD
jgi:hypothetical protein